MSQPQLNQIVMIDGWVGRIIDIARLESGGVMVLVESPKMVYRNGRAEWLEFIEGRIKPISFLETEKFFSLYMEQTVKRLEELDLMREQWGKTAVKEISDG